MAERQAPSYKTIFPDVRRSLRRVALLADQGDEAAADFVGDERASLLLCDELELLTLDRTDGDDEASTFA